MTDAELIRELRECAQDYARFPLQNEGLISVLINAADALSRAAGEIERANQDRHGLALDARAHLDRALSAEAEAAALRADAERYRCFAPQLGDSAHACNCIGPQNGQPRCPCQMRYVIVKNGRYVQPEVIWLPILLTGVLGYLMATIPAESRGGWMDFTPIVRTLWLIPMLLVWVIYLALT